MWVIGGVGAIIIFLAGFTLNHTQEPGHPVVMEKVYDVKEDLAEFRAEQKQANREILQKLDELNGR